MCSIALNVNKTAKSRRSTHLTFKCRFFVALTFLWFCQRLFVSDQCVTFTRDVFELSAVGNLYMAARIVDQTARMKLDSGFIDRFAADTEHVRQKLLSKLEI